MCGIAGILNFDDRHDPPSRELMGRMVQAIRHRGPEEFGLYRDARAGLASARLCIVDLATGSQPISNEDESVWIAFNGEIFNFVELRVELEKRGHHFRSHCDTEVAVHAYEEWGEDCFRRFNGQWALAIWDSARRRLTLSRDPIGILPLFVHEHGGRLWFGSEVKAIFTDPSVPRAIDPRGLDETFTYWACVAPSSVFDGIEELPPATARTYDQDGRHHDTVYWKPAFPQSGSGDGARRMSLDEATEALREKLERATRLRMLRADVPVGSYLSGGIDSSVIAQMGRAAKEGEFRTFSVTFEDAEYDESSFQRLMSSRLGSAHSSCSVTRSDIARVFPEVVAHAERPLLRTAAAPLFLLSKAVREAGFKVVLTGEGADEVLAGYDLFREAKVRMFLSHEPGSEARAKLFERLYPYLSRAPQMAKGMALEFWKRGLDRAGEPGFSHEPRWSTTSMLKRLFSAEMRSAVAQHPGRNVLEHLPREFRLWDPLAQAQYLEVVTLLSSYIISSQGDRMLMAHSVEGRFPFLDTDVMDFCNGLPAEYKLIGLNEKNILKRAAKGLIPDEIIKRKKQPYRAPDATCFVGAGAPGYVADLFSERSLAEAGVFDVKAARGLYDKCRSRAHSGDGAEGFSNVDNMGLVGVISTQLLVEKYISAPPRLQGEPVMFKTEIDRVPVLSP